MDNQPTKNQLYELVAALNAPMGTTVYFGLHTSEGKPLVYVMENSAARLQPLKPAGVYGIVESGDTMEWTGSEIGSRALALSILAHHFHETPSSTQVNAGLLRSWPPHLAFRWDFISRLPSDSPWFISREQIDAWHEVWKRTHTAGSES